MLKLKEWNEVYAYGIGLCNNLKKQGHDVRLVSYTMYDGRKGVFLQLFGSNGELYSQYASGIHNNVLDFKRALDNGIKNIIKEI